MQVNPLLSNLSQVPQQVQQSQQSSVSTQQSPVVTQTTVAVLAVGQSESSAPQANTDRKRQVDQKELDQAVKHLNDTAHLFNTELLFAVDPSTGRQVVKVTDRGTNEVIRQIPSEEVLRLSKALDDFKGLLVKDSA